MRVDLFGVIDIVSCKSGTPIWGVQATSGSHIATHVSKAKAEVRLKAWLTSMGSRYLIVGWTRREPSEGRKRPTWDMKVVELFLRDNEVCEERRNSSDF
jgi:hypothetical protein